MRVLCVLALATMLYSCGIGDDEIAGDDEAPVATDTPATDGYVADKTIPPDAVRTAFNTDYPDASGTEWEIEDTLYEASFMNGELPMSAIYTRDGMRYATVRSINNMHVPEAVRKAANTLAGEVTDIDAITLHNGTMLYEVDVRGKEYVFDQQGGMVDYWMVGDGYDDERR